MSDDRTPREPAPGAALACTDGVTPETLSAWRDGLLPADQTQWLAVHAPACPACSARLRDYEQIGAALRGQIIPQSAADPWPAMRQRIEREGRERRERRLSLPRWGGLGALVAAALLVALFAGLLAQQAARRPAPGSTATVAATHVASPTTTTPALGAWTQIPSYKGLYGLTVAPSNPRVAYQIWWSSSGGTDSAGSGLMLRRTDDQGATWHALPAPHIAHAAYPVIGSELDGFVDPFNPQTVYLQMGAQMDNQTAPCPNFGEAPLCVFTFVSTDGGERWQPLALPVAGRFSAPQIGAGGGFTGQRDSGDAASPSRLYSSIFQRSQQTLRLIRSDDNGVSWRLIDAPIVAAGQFVTAFTAPATGSTIFALAAPPSGSGTPPTGVTIWSSDDGGASWSNLGPASNNIVLYMVATQVAKSGKPILYLLTTDDRNNEYIQGSLYGASGSFHIAPDPTPPCTPAGNSYLLGSLADGSVLAWCGGAIEAWLTLPARVDQGWQMVAPNPGVKTISTAFTQTLPDGSSRLWLLTQDNTGAVAQYITLPN